MEPSLLITAYVILGVVFVWTSIIDIRIREVPDWLSASLLVLGLGLAALSDSVATSSLALFVGLGVASVFVSFFLFDGFVFFPGVSSHASRQPQLIQAVVSLLLAIAVFAVAAALGSVVPALGFSLAGAAVGYGLGAALFWAGQWGGGDAKLLAGTGAVLGFDPAYLQVLASGSLFPAPSFVWFLVLLLLCGAAYGFVWVAVVAVYHRKQFVPAFREMLAKRSSWRVSAWVASSLCVIGALVAGLVLSPFLALPLSILAALVFAGFYLVIAVSAAEQSCMIVMKRPSELVPGDWVLGPVKMGSRVIIAGERSGVTEDEIARLRSFVPKMRVRVRQGVPFVPSFFFAFCILSALRWGLFA